MALIVGIGSITGIVTTQAEALLTQWQEHAKTILEEAINKRSFTKLKGVLEEVKDMGLASLAEWKVGAESSSPFGTRWCYDC